VALLLNVVRHALAITRGALAANRSSG